MAKLILAKIPDRLPRHVTVLAEAERLRRAEAHKRQLAEIRKQEHAKQLQEQQAAKRKLAEQQTEQHRLEEQRLAEINAGKQAERQAAEQAAARIRRREQTEQTIGLLRDRFPQAFTSPPVPLAVGIHRQLREATRAEIPAQRLSAALSFWTNSREYLEGLAAGEPRRNLDGSIAGPVDTEHVQKAKEILKERAARWKKMRKAG